MTQYDSALAALQLGFAVLFGLAFGSFGTVLATRLLDGESISKDSSHCRSCNAPLTWRENIPLFSWLVQRGKCRHCAAKIPAAYPLSELTTAVLFALTVGTTFNLASVAMAGLAVVTAPLFWTDLKTHRLPNGLTYGLALFGIGLALLSFFTDGSTARLTDALTWGIVPAALLFVLNLASRGGMGLGDVKLALGLGIVLALGSIEALATGFIVAFALAAVMALATLIARRGNMKSAIPFGPYLLVGAWISYLVGPTLQALILAPWAVTF